VIDCGPDFRQQMLSHHVNSLDAILVTHGHKDHLGGLDDVRAYNYVLRKPTDVFASADVRRIIKREFSYAFEKDPYPGVLEINLHPITGKPFKFHDLRIVPIRATHFNNEHFVYGFRLGEFTYITDAVSISDSEKDKIRGSKVIVLNALRKEKHYSHFNLEEALRIMEELRPDRGFLTHISHQMGLYSEVSEELPEYVSLAYDGLKVSVSDGS